MAEKLSFKYVIEECESEDQKEAGSDDEEANLDEDEINKKFVFTAKAEQTYFAIRGGKAKRVDAASVVEVAFRRETSHLSAEACRGPRHDAESMRS
ncbi:hypothetical protein DPMN_124753 [Dreissena polymorpha]|uniref:Uncharacterized protein n=1 Tax=Dreissena polymorpha TaxID=45954 RepID=A0A9D4GWY6_DREPO|nr:hypothetical protein DPMN_124753 [Dreissena polymorpha]